LKGLDIFYRLKPFIPRSVQLWLRRQLIQRKLLQYQEVWPIDPNSGTPPPNWTGWPENKAFAFVLTHDVDTIYGQNKCRALLNLETELGFRSSFNFVPERYEVSDELRKQLKEKGFEVGVHGLNHDGKLFQSRETFLERTRKINRYIQSWQAEGFRSPAMHHNLDWIHELNILYDSSTFDTDPFEPQSDGVGTIFPFYVRKEGCKSGYLELPYTLSQDFTPFILMREKSINLWRKKLDWIAEKGGMALLNVHPDYIGFDKDHLGREEYDKTYYIEFLTYVKEYYQDQYWHVLPRDLADFWVKNRKHYELEKA
jgi:peptidoglycan/xylan/chitin deacetylase (PgdA/CDA1 family)